MWDSYPPWFHGVFELVMTAFHCHLKPTIRNHKLNHLSTSHCLTYQCVYYTLQNGNALFCTHETHQ